jgi:hypothetical protein
MTPGGALVLLVLLAVAGLSVATLVTAVRGGRGPADPPASHLRTDLSGFPVLSAPRGALHRAPRRARPGTARPSARLGRGVRLVRGVRRTSPAR